MELLILYPYDMVIKRFLSVPRMASAITAFHGDDAWRAEYATSKGLGEDEDTMRNRFVGSYKRKLANLGYRYVVDYGPFGYRHINYYNVAFASDHPAGLKIMNDVWAKPRSIPGELGYERVKRPMMQ